MRANHVKKKDVNVKLGFTLYILTNTQIPALCRGFVILQFMKQLLIMSLLFSLLAPKVVHALTLQEKIDQLFIIGFTESVATPTSTIVSLLTQTNLGGVFLTEQDETPFKRPIQNPSQLKQLTKDLQSYAQTPLMIAIDEEGGSVRAFKKKHGFEEILGSAFSYTNKPLSHVQHDSAQVALYARSFGINTNFAPIADLRINPQNPIIGKFNRSYRRHPWRSIEYAQAFINGHKKHVMITTLKHYPGHGSSIEDSHTSKADITKTYSPHELLPFLHFAKRNSVPMIMTGHLINTNIDTLPASLSKKHIQQLRKAGFTGVIVSDDMDMHAISKEFKKEDAIIKALQAGNDMIIMSFYETGSPIDFLSIRKIVYDAVINGTLTEKDVNEKYQRVQKLKREYRIIQ